MSRAPLKSSVSGAGRGAGTARSSDSSDVTAARLREAEPGAKKLGPDPPPGAEDVAKTTVGFGAARRSRLFAVVSSAKISEASSGAGTPGGAARAARPRRTRPLERLPGLARVARRREDRAFGVAAHHCAPPARGVLE